MKRKQIDWQLNEFERMFEELYYTTLSFDVLSILNRDLKYGVNDSMSYICAELEWNLRRD